MTDFVPGLELSRAFYAEVVQELVGRVPHSAALLGTGSEVLGYDTARSTDHGWGPRLHVFVARENVERVRAEVADGLPDSFRGSPTGTAGTTCRSRTTSRFSRSRSGF